MSIIFADLLPEIFRRIAHDKVELLECLSHTCKYLHTKLKDTIKVLLRETYRNIRAPLYRYGSMKYRTYESKLTTIHVDGDNIQVLRIDIENTKSAFAVQILADQEYDLDAVIIQHSICNWADMIIEQRVFRKYKRHGSSYRWIFSCSTLKESKNNAAIGHAACEYSYGKYIRQIPYLNCTHNIYYLSDDTWAHAK